MHASNKKKNYHPLRIARLQHQWSQRELAERLGATIVTVKRWERQATIPSPYFRSKLTALFGKSEEELGLRTDSPTMPLAQQEEIDKEHTESPIPLWTVPYRRNPHFTGRAELLSQLELQLTPRQTINSSSIHDEPLIQTLAIKGIGGIGKTQIAIEYAYRARTQRHFTHTFWVTASNVETILASFVHLAKLLPDIENDSTTNPHKLAAIVIDWLERCPHSWLLILDNANDLTLVQPFLPRQGNGAILLTTRVHAVNSLASSLEVDSMNIMESIHLLLHRAHRYIDATDEEINDASNLVTELGEFPLALDQAGAYIEETGCSINNYLLLYKTHRYILLARRGKQATGYAESVVTTWTPLFQQIEQANPAAIELLHLCAFLSPDHIPESLLIEGAPYWPPFLQQAVTDSFSFNQLLETLLSFSLVKRLAKGHHLSIHQMVQVIQIEMMPQAEQIQWAERVIRAVNAFIFHHPPHKEDNGSQCAHYMEQIQACDTLIQTYHLGIPEAANILDQMGIYLCEHALYNLAEQLLVRALNIREQYAGLETLPTATSLHHLASLYWKQGKPAQAEPLYQQALHIREHILGIEHPDVAEILNDLASLYCEPRLFFP